MAARNPAPNHGAGPPKKRWTILLLRNIPGSQGIEQVRQLHLGALNLGKEIRIAHDLRLLDPRAPYRQGKAADDLGAGACCKPSREIPTSLMSSLRCVVLHTWTSPRLEDPASPASHCDGERRGNPGTALGKRRTKPSDHMQELAVINGVNGATACHGRPKEGRRCNGPDLNPPPGLPSHYLPL